MEGMGGIAAVGAAGRRCLISMLPFGAGAARRCTGDGGGVVGVWGVVEAGLLTRAGVVASAYARPASQ